MNTQKSRTKSALLNMVFNFVYQIINTVVNIIIPPLIIGKYGSIINGLISTIKQILGYVQLIGAGISESTVVSLYKPLAENNKKKISEIFNACSITFFKMGVIFNILSVGVALIYPLFIKEELKYGFLVLLILVLSIAGSSEFFVIGKCRSLLIADQKIYIVNIAQIIGALANLFLTIVLVSCNVNIVIVQAGASIVYAMRIIVVYSYVKKHYDFLDKKQLPDMRAIDKRKAATIHQLSALICFGSQTVFVSVFCGLAEASVYSVYNLVFTGINTILSTVSSALLATFGDIVVNEDKSKVRKLFSLYESFFYILAFALYSITYAMFLSFVSLYTQNATDAIYHRPELSFLFCILGVVSCLRTPGVTLICAAGHYEETKNRALIEMAICFSLECIFVHKFKVVGILLATVIAELYRTVDILLYSNHQILEHSSTRTWKKVLINIFVCGIVWGIVRIANINANNYVEWFINACVVGVVVMLFFFSANYFCSKEEYQEFFKRFLKKRY